MIWLRSTAYNLWFYGLTLLFALASLPLRAFVPGFVWPFARAWARTMLAGLRPICGIAWVVSGREHLPDAGPALIASMHQSAFDTVVWVLLRPRVAYVLKQELLRIPLFGPMLRLTGMIPVDRAAGAAAVRALMRAADRAVADGRSIVIFPEGTRVAPGVRAPLLPGLLALAQRTGLPVIPVVTDSGLRWGRKAFRKRPGTIHVAIQPPIPPGLPREALQARLETAFAEGYARLGHHVDNSVGDGTSGFVRSASQTT